MARTGKPAFTVENQHPPLRTASQLLAPLLIHRGGRHFKRDYGVPKEKNQSNFTDPQSRIMKTNEGFQQCNNGQLAVDGEFQMIVANRQGSNALITAVWCRCWTTWKKPWEVTRAMSG